MPLHWLARFSLAVTAGAAIPLCGAIPAAAAGADGQPTGGQAQQSAAIADQELDNIYQYLNARLNWQQQSDLSADQTNWLNDRDATCTHDGVLDDLCLASLTRARIVVLTARLNVPVWRPNPAPLAAPPPRLAAQPLSAIPPPAAPAVPIKPMPESDRLSLMRALAATESVNQPPNSDLERFEDGALASASSDRALAPPPDAKPPAPAIDAQKMSSPSSVPMPQPAKPPTVAVANQRPASPTAPATPGATTVTVPATAMPWLWKSGGINAAFQFGYPDGTTPTIVPLTRLGAAPVHALTIKCVAGSIRLGPGTPPVSALGYPGMDSQGGSGPVGLYPSAYMAPYPINLAALVGAFTTAKGAIVGTPFAVGDGPVDEAVPPGAAQLQLGINDDIFGAGDPATGNSGVLTVTVSVR